MSDPGPSPDRAPDCPLLQPVNVDGVLEYATGVRWQEALMAQLLAARGQGGAGAGYVLSVTHPHVYTMGKSAKPGNMLIDEAGLERIGATLHPTGRGGDITYHGPGQVVLYPVLDLEYFFTDMHRYLRTLEQAVIDVLTGYGLEAGRVEGLTGVWLGMGEKAAERKICAMGVRASRWIVMHGLALNVSTDLSYFGHIIPCNIPDKAVTSLHAELKGRSDGSLPAPEQVAGELILALARQLGAALAPPQTWSAEGPGPLLTTPDPSLILTH